LSERPDSIRGGRANFITVAVWLTIEIGPQFPLSS
jgi:hypothetical protein